VLPNGLSALYRLSCEMAISEERGRVMEQELQELLHCAPLGSVQRRGLEGWEHAAEVFGGISESLREMSTGLDTGGKIGPDAWGPWLQQMKLWLAFPACSQERLVLGLLTAVLRGGSRQGLWPALSGRPALRMALCSPPQLLAPSLPPAPDPLRMALCSSLQLVAP
jgi:hypothetical protein